MKVNKDLSKALRADKVLAKNLKVIVQNAEKNSPSSFTYVKENGERSQRRVRFGVSTEKRLEKEGRPVNGKGSWMTGHTSGKEGMIAFKDGKVYVRGTMMNKTENGKFENVPGHRLFILSQISNLKEEND